MELGLRGRTAFVSGSTQGIGYAIASSLAAEGARVVLNGREAERVDAAVDRLRRERPDAEVAGTAADFADPEQVARLLDRLDRFVGTDGLIDARQEVIDDRISRLDDRIADWDDRLLQREDMLREQFARLQEALELFNGQQGLVNSFFFGGGQSLF